MSFFWEHESDRCRYPNFEVHTYPWPQYTILDSRFPPVMRSRKAGLPFGLGSSRYRRYVSRMTRTKNFLSQNVFKVFLKTTFFHDSCQPDEPKIFFRFSKSGSTLRYTILDSRVPPCNAISEGRLPLCNTSSEAGALHTGVALTIALSLAVARDRRRRK